MREILYRAKAINRDPDWNYRTDYQNGDWVYGLISKLYRYDDKYFAEMTNTDGVSGIDVDPETVCEFTGLTDKNGNKIFEGDILEWDRREWGGEFNEVVRFDYGQLNMRKNDWHEWCEIIGNIYDNPEHLEK